MATSAVLRSVVAAWFVGAWLELAAEPALLVALLLGAGRPDADDHDGAGCGSHEALPRPRPAPKRVRVGVVRCDSDDPDRRHCAVRCRNRDGGQQSAASVTSTLVVGRASTDAPNWSRRRSTSFRTSGDPLLAWTPYPWVYLNLRRVSATRYIWKSFLMGEIYLGNSGPEYVLPGTWEHFLDDVEATNPSAVLRRERRSRLPPEHRSSRSLTTRFQTVFRDDGGRVGVPKRSRAIADPLPCDGGPRARLNSAWARTVATRIDASSLSPSDGERAALRVRSGEQSARSGDEPTAGGDRTQPERPRTMLEVVSQPWHRSAIAIDVPIESDPVDFTLAIGPAQRR